MSKYSKSDVKELLTSGVAVVIFDKSDGTERSMKCTLKSDTIPQSTSTHHRTENADQLSVWDIDKGGWRSFRVDSVKDVKPCS